MVEVTEVKKGLNELVLLDEHDELCDVCQGDIYTLADCLQTFLTVLSFINST